MLIDIFSNNLRKYRIQKGFSQEKLAELSGLHRTYIGGIEGRTRNVSLRTIEKLANVLEISPDILLIGGEKYGKQRIEK